MMDYVRAHNENVHHVNILRNSETVFSADFYPYSGGVLHDVASVTKSITSTLIGMAIDRGLIAGADVPVLSFFPDVSIAHPDVRKQELTIRELLTMTSGFCDDFSAGEAQLEAMRRDADAVHFMLNQPLVSEPGERFAYCSGASQLLSAILTRATGMNALTFAEAHLFGPLGIQEVIWPADPQGNNNGWGDLFIRPEDLAKIGQLFLERGTWAGQRLLSEAWVTEATSEHIRVADDEGYGFSWWRPDGLAGLYEGRGRGGQRLVVWPEKRIVVVMIGSGFDPGAVGRFIVEAVQSDEPLRPNPEAHQRLREKVSAASLPPPPKPVGPLPAIASVISDRQFRFEPNEIGLTSFRLGFPGGSEALLTLSLAIVRSQEFGDRVSPVGLDGRYRISPTSRFGLPLAARGEWTGNETFHLVYDEFANNHMYDITIRFSESRAVWHMTERSGLFDITLEATSDGQ
jgi:CubicO group peptidase (beta-lactamase class C family)